MSLVGNERTKLMANACDRASTACIVVGALGPIASSPDRSVTTLALAASVAPWLVVAACLHGLAVILLGRLR